MKEPKFPVMPDSQSIQALIANLKAEWNRRPGGMDWLGLENILVAILRNQQVSPDSQILLVKEAIDAFTRRGHFQPSEYFTTI
jgi:hypothetical protein